MARGREGLVERARAGSRIRQKHPEKVGRLGRILSILLPFSSSGNVTVIYCRFLISQRGGGEMSF